MPLTQASVLTLYDPDRSQVVSNVGRISTWGPFRSPEPALGDTAARKGRGAASTDRDRHLADPGAATPDAPRRFPAAKWHQYEPVNSDHSAGGARLAFGEDVETQYRFEQAEVILALDADFSR